MFLKAPSKEGAFLFLLRAIWNDALIDIVKRLNLPTGEEVINTIKKPRGCGVCLVCSEFYLKNNISRYFGRAQY